MRYRRRRSPGRKRFSRARGRVRRMSSRIAMRTRLGRRF